MSLRVDRSNVAHSQPSEPLRDSGSTAQATRSGAVQDASTFEGPALTSAPQVSREELLSKASGSGLGSWLKGAAKAVGNAVSTVVNRAGDAVRSVATGVANAVVGTVKNVGEGMGTFFGGVGKLFTGDFKGGLSQMGSGLVKTFLQTPVDNLLMLGGRAVSAIQTMVGLEPVGRKLKDSEIAELRKVYGDSIDYSSVRLKEGNVGVFGLTGRAFTHGNTIYIPNGSLPLTTDLLVHEMGHVWQHQNGGTDYMSEALWAQNVGDGYDFEKGIQEGKAWSQLNPEQQSELLQQAYASGFFDGPGRKFEYNGHDYTAYLNQAIEQIRRGDGAP